MRHNKKFNHLGRTSSHRKATLANMAASLVMHKRIETTIAKAKALRMYVEPLITRAKDDSTHSRRVVFSYLKDKFAVTELFRVVAPAIGTRPGGYTRILKTGFRLGDGADMCFIELVDFNGTYKEGVKAGSGSAVGKTRTRRGGSKAASASTEGVSAEVAEGSVDGAVSAAGKVASTASAKGSGAAGKTGAGKGASSKSAGAGSKPKAAPAPRATKTSGSKAAAGRSMASKKG